MDAPASCATSCVIPTADECNHSAMGTLHPHHSATCILYVTLLTLCCPIPPKKEKKMLLPKWRYKPPPKFPLEQWINEIACNSAYIQTETKFHLCLPSCYCLCRHWILMFLHLLQLLRNRHTQCQISMYKPIIVANNFGLYINSRQKINMADYINPTSTCAHRISFYTR